MSESILDGIKARLAKTKPITMENRGGGCLENALKLRDQHKGGKMYWVGNLDESGTDLSIQHAYFVPPNANESDLALNQADNGYPQYLELTVGELKQIGQELSESIVRDTVRAAKRR
jgi:hypothetical protein